MLASLWAKGRALLDAPVTPGRAGWLYSASIGLQRMHERSLNSVSTMPGSHAVECSPSIWSSCFVFGSLYSEHSHKKRASTLPWHYFWHRRRGGCGRGQAWGGAFWISAGGYRGGGKQTVKVLWQAKNKQGQPEKSLGGQPANVEGRWVGRVESWRFIARASSGSNLCN